MRLLNVKSIDQAALGIEINNALEELVQRIRDAREDWLLRIATDHIVSGQDVYPLPDDCGDLIMLERMDINDEPAVQLRKVAYDKAWMADVVTLQRYDTDYLYAPLPDRQIRLLPVPSGSMENGLRFTYHKRIPALLLDDESPAVPEEIHEWLVVGALDRIRQYGGVELAKPQEFEQFRQEQGRRLDKFLRPAYMDEAPTWGDDDDLYMWQ